MEPGDDDYPISPNALLKVLTHVHKNGDWNWEQIAPTVGLSASTIEQLWEKDLKRKFPSSDMAAAIRKLELRVHPFSQSDDEAIRTAVYSEGIGQVDWFALAHRLGKPTRLVREHYCDLEGSVYPWKPNEDMQIRELCKELGPQWKKIARTLINRRWPEVRARYMFLKARDRLGVAVVRGVKQEAVTLERRDEQGRSVFGRRLTIDEMVDLHL
jgi:hypothetical protein